MIKILLADDNKMALDYFSHLVDWEKYGFKLVATAIDGESALIQFKQTYPDIVITDIQMPNMTGIQLAEKINAIAPETIIIFLSSYEEFEYVRSALDLGIFDYILKHETKEKDLIEKLMKAKETLEKKKRERYYISEGDLSYFLNNIKHKKDREKNVMLKVFPSKYHMFAICHDHIFMPLGQIVKQTTLPIEENNFKNVLYSFKDIIAAVKLDNYFHVVLSRAVCNPIDLYYEIKNAFEEEFNEPVSILSLEEDSNIIRCMEQFEKYSKLFEQKIFYPKSIVLYKNSLKQADEKKITILNTEEIMSMIENNMFSKLCRELDNIFLQILQKKSYSDLKKITESCASVLVSFHHEQIDMKTKTLFNAYDIHSLNYWYEAETIFEWIKEKFSRLGNIISDTDINSYSQNVKKIFSYVYRNYGNVDLSAEQIAENFGININKLNSQLKKEAGETIWQLIIKVRMEKASEMLNMNKYKISEISELVGYRTVSHFSNVFKKFFGISPQDYRRSHEE